MEITTLLLTIVTACFCLYRFVLSKMSHFKRLKVPHLRPFPVVGNMGPFFFQRMSMPETIDKAYKQFSDAKYFGFYEFTRPTYVIRDPDLINTIAIKNFDNFTDHRNFVNEELDKMASKNLFGLKGDHWREMRKLLSPSFTSSKMKSMFELICQCADNLTDFLSESKTGKTYDVKNLLCRYSNDVVATCAFGISVDSFKHPENEFFALGRKALTFNAKLSFKFFLNRNFPWLARLIGVRIFGAEVERFFKEVVTSTVKARDERGIVRPDMIQLMMETRDKNSGPTFDIDEMTAQAFVFFLGGFDSVSTIMCFLLHEVAVNPHVRAKLRSEIDDVVRQTNGKPTYDALKNMKYLDAVLNECLRLYPLGGFLDRLCVKEYELPPATPDGKPVTVKPGESIWFAHFSIQRDPKYFDEPNKFDPDRFLNDQVDNSVYIPFGIGPRLCIGNRFALMEAKVMLFHLLWRCDVEPTAKTRNPMVLDKKTFVMMADGGFWLNFNARKSTTTAIKADMLNGQNSK